MTEISEETEQEADKLKKLYNQAYPNRNSADNIDEILQYAIEEHMQIILSNPRTELSTQQIVGFFMTEELDNPTLVSMPKTSAYQLKVMEKEKAEELSERQKDAYILDKSRE